MSTDPWGIDATYEDAAGKIQTVSEQAIEGIRTAIGRPPDPARSLYDERVKVLQQGQSLSLPAAAELKLEDGSVRQVRDQLPDDLPIGYHQLVPIGGSSPLRLIVSPRRCHLPPGLRIWGWSAQVYAARSRQSWGIGDLADLRRLAQWSEDLGAGMVLINPLHAALPVLPQEASPYSPSSRRYLNPLYLRIEELPGAARLEQDLQRLATLGRALNEDRHIDRDRVFRLKQEAFQLLWSRFEGDSDFEQFRVGEGRPLHQFAVFCALVEEHGANWRQWRLAYRRPDSPDVEQFTHAHADRVRFHEWLQWLLNQQLTRAAQHVSLMQDLPVGFSPDGADAWVWQDLIATDMTIGAPPDLYSPDGQDWGLPPFIPHKLREAAYEPFIQTIRAVLRHAGGLRIDHVMGLFRLWWVPKARMPKNGAYVRYPAEDLLAIIAIESQRAGAVVVGEDLGTVEPGVREKLADHNVLSYRLLWFEDTPPSNYPEKALAAITTHDLPTLAGIWTGADLETQRRLGLNPDESANQKFREKLLETSGLDADADVTLAITKTFEQLAQAPSAIVMASMEAACVAAERPNMPAAAGKYPNWSLALPLPLEDLESSELPRRLAKILNRRSGTQMQRGLTVRTEIATYRLQMCGGFTLDDAAAIAEYLAQLGISHLYSSPVLQAGKGSTHGYDVLDHTRVSRELGGEAAFERLSVALLKHDLGLLLDIVPNHMAIGGKDNLWWWDVLENGQSSRYAPYFDVEWMPPESKLHHVVMLPVLGDHYGRILDAGDIHIERHDGAFTVHYHDHVFPVAPPSLQFILTRAASGAASEDLTFFADALEHLPSSWATDWVSLQRRHRDKGILGTLLTRFLQEDPGVAAAVDRIIEEINRDHQALHDLLERQNYRLAFWRTARQDLGYRRFFDINTLIGLRTEHEQVFADIHDLVFRWLRSNGPVDGVRVDHPDGLLDPEQYLIRLRDRVPSGWIVVEKILMPDEQLRASWPVSGTTGYDFMNQVMGLFIDQDSEEPLTRFYGDFTGETRRFPDILREKKLHILRQMLGSDLNILSSMLLNICERHPHHRDYTRHGLHDALRELMVDFPVYRTYVRPRGGHVTEDDERVVTRAVQSVGTRRADLGGDLLGFIRDILLLKVAGDLESEFVARFQQVTGPVMAKGAEDTAFYCYHRFIALNEVGGDPGRYGVTVDQFHTWCQNMQRHWPKTMLSTSTHDTKRSEDVRARLVVLSEMPTRWMETVSAWSKRHFRYWGTQTPDHNFEYFLYQTLVGAWPLEQERALTYCEKAVREAKAHTSWTDPHTDYEDTIRSFVRSLYEDEEFIQELDRFVDDLEKYGHQTSLAQTLIKLTAPGIPDLYQGTELWNFSLVDPDNRRLVDYDVRRRLLHELPGLSPEAIWQRRQEGLPKLWIIRQALRVRHERAQAFGPQGHYSPLYARGEKSSHVVSFMRGGEVIVIAPRLFLSLKEGWHQTVIELPEGRWRHEFDGRVFDGGICRLQEVLRTFPVGLLCKIA